MAWEVRPRLAMMIRKTTSGRAATDDIPDPIEPAGDGWWMEGCLVFPDHDALGNYTIAWFWVKEDKEEDDRG